MRKQTNPHILLALKEAKLLQRELLDVTGEKDLGDELRKAARRIGSTDPYASEIKDAALGYRKFRKFLFSAAQELDFIRMNLQSASKKLR